MTRILLLGLLVALSCHAATISILQLSNYQSSGSQSCDLTCSLLPLSFGGASELTSQQYGQVPPGSLQFIIPVTGEAQLTSGLKAQFISSTASVDFYAPEYYVTSIQRFGFVADGDGDWVREDAGFYLTSCVPDCGVRMKGGTLHAFLDVYTTAETAPWADFGRAQGGAVVLTVIHNPEPGTWVLMLLGVALLAIAWRPSV